MLSPHILYSNYKTFSEDSRWTTIKTLHKLHFNWIANHPHGPLVYYILFPLHDNPPSKNNAMITKHCWMSNHTLFLRWPVENWPLT